MVLENQLLVIWFKKTNSMFKRSNTRHTKQGVKGSQPWPSFVTSSKPQENITKLGSTSHGNKYEQNINILTFKIEGIKSNLQYLHELLDQKSIICLQEHLLWNFESDYIINKTEYEVFVRCHDCDHPISNYKVLRGKGGIAIIWPTLIDKYIKRLEDGNNRIMAIEIQSTSKAICLVNTYLPTQMLSLRIQVMSGHTTDYNRKV